MVRQLNDQSWNYGSSPAQGSTPHPNASSADVAHCFVRGIKDTASESSKQYGVPCFDNPTILGDICPSVWGPASKRP